MRRVSVIIGIALLLVGVGVFAQESYDSDVAVSIMRSNGQAFGMLRSAAAENDFLAAAGALATLANGSLTLMEFEPPKGSEAEWMRVHTELVAAALSGIIACSEEDAEGLATAVSAMGGFSREGHGQFR